MCQRTLFDNVAEHPAGPFALLIAAFTCACAVVAFAALRVWATCRHNQYDPRQSSTISFTGNDVQILSFTYQNGGFSLPQIDENAVSAILELNVSSSAFGWLSDPVIQIAASGFQEEIWMDRGCSGLRQIDVSRLLRTNIGTGKQVAVQFRRLRLRSLELRLYLSLVRVTNSDRVLVMAPHPDDAEIAAYGLYSTSSATIVTVTAGEGTNRFDGTNGASIKLSPGLVNRVRCWDSLTIPQLGGVSTNHTINLCYPDGGLKSLHQRQGTNPVARDDADSSIRQMNRSPLLRHSFNCSWEDLVADLQFVIDQTRPTIVVTPHPDLDPHPDHLYTTTALAEALERNPQLQPDFYFYTNHNRCTEMWPFGAAGTGLMILPVMAGDHLGCTGFYSHSLSAERQSEKYVALEAMHDLRDLISPRKGSIRAHASLVRRQLAAALTDSLLPPTSYLRRAVRPDEFFWTAPWNIGSQLCKRGVEIGSA